LCTASDHRYIAVNDSFERQTGWMREEVIGQTPVDLGIWADPKERTQLLEQMASGATIRNVEMRARTKSGDIRTGSLSALLMEISGRRCVLCVVADLTYARQVEEATQTAELLSRMSRKLIQAQEAERDWIARELHEHVERLCLLSIELQRFRNIEAAQLQIEELVADCQALAGRLQSTKLEVLGLNAAVASFCKELSNPAKIEIEFVSKGSRRPVAKEIALSLYRVLQEGLQNAASYSASKRIQVTLAYHPGEVELTVRDSGTGFDVQKALKEGGFGLRIMRERLRLVNGELSIESQPGCGTVIHARVAYRAAKSAQASR
jgi:PAS domain S-box-containing protein